jgi:hypothetical protein
MGAISGPTLQRLARARFQRETGRTWRDAPPEERRRWFRHIEPVLREEHGIAADAVWRQGTWQPAEQLGLFADEEVTGNA